MNQTNAAGKYWRGSIEAADPVERDAVNFKKLAAHVAEVAVSSPLYKERFAQHGVDPTRITDIESLAAVPPIRKTDIQADQAVNPPYGSLIAVDPDQIVRQYYSPGPQTTYWTKDDLATVVDDGAWAFFTNGFRAHDTVDVTIMYHWVPAGTLMDESYRAIGCAVVPGGIGNPQQHLDAWRWLKVTALFAFPTFLDEIADTVQRAGIDPATDLNLRIATVSGEQRAADAKTRMEEFWGGMKVREIYGGAEVPFIAAEPEEGGWMHVNPDLVVEVVDPETLQPVPEGQPGVVVATDFRRVAYPMIRYFTGDIIEGHTTEPGASGRTTMRIGRIIGRYGDIPRVKGLFVVPKQVQGVLDGVGGLGRYQMVIDRPGNQDTLTIRVEGPTDGTKPDDGFRTRIIDALREGIRLTTEVELVAPGSLGDVPLIDDRRRL